jgi:hypothetical protein
MAGKQSSAMDKAQKSIESGKMNAQQAAAKYGLSAVSIQRKTWYRQHMAAQAAKAAP